ncbi:unnamed protein product [Rhodiola kirilowii]
MSWNNRGTLFLYLCCFCSGILFTNRIWSESEYGGITKALISSEAEQLNIILNGCAPIKSKDAIHHFYKAQNPMNTLDKTITNLQMKLAAARTAQKSMPEISPESDHPDDAKLEKRKYLMVIGINTAFSSRKRRDALRSTWLPQGDKRRKLEKEKGIVIRFVIGHSSASGGILDRAIVAEDEKHGDMLRLDHIEGYMEMSAKTKSYFATAVVLWDAEFYVKVDDDVHVNIATLGETLSRQRKKKMVYVGCMKSGLVIAQKGVRYHEPEHWKFGEKYFRHATGQIYAISKYLAVYISVNQHVLHKYANEDVTLGSWFIGLDVKYVDDRRLCCGTPPDCELKARAGNVCVASFDWSCSGICKSAERIKEVHRRCGEGDKALQRAAF